MTILLHTSTLSTSSTMEQPGRLFNKTLIINNNDSFFFQEKRRQQQQQQQQQLIPIPPAKSMGGGGGGVSLLEASPVCVKDVKHFDNSPPLNVNVNVNVNVNDYYEGNGVAIDDVDDLLLQEQQEEEEQRLLSCQRQQVQQQQQRASSFLAPIFEERHVTFAAQHVVSKVNDSDTNNNNNNNDCGIDQRFVHQVFDAVQVWYIPHHDDYSDEERSNMWYTHLEMHAMKVNAIESKLSKRRELKKAHQKELEAKFEAELDLDICASLFPSPFARGMMWKQQKKALLTAENNSNNNNNNDSDDDYHPDCRRCRYEETMDAVFLEQYEQRMMCLRVYGRVDHGYSGILDPERLARVYSTVGDTQRCQERAVAKAMKSLLQEEDDSDDDDDDDDADSENSNSSSSSLDDTNHNHGEDTTADNCNATSPSTSTSSSKKSSSKSKSSKSTIKRSSSFNNSKLSLSFETSNCLDKSVSSLFQVLLTPFLEMRQGDLFLGIGEEMSIE